MTGILISGKMAVGVRSKTKGVRRMITSAITIKVYGLCSAKRTIHILFFEFLQSGDFVVTRTLRPATKTTALSIRPREPWFGYVDRLSRPGRMRYIVINAISQEFRIRKTKSWPAMEAFFDFRAC